MGGGGTLAVTVDWKVGLGPTGGDSPGGPLLAAVAHGPSPVPHDPVLGPSSGGPGTIPSAQPPPSAAADAAMAHTPSVDLLMLDLMLGPMAGRK
jgi:hypothetical protein